MFILTFIVDKVHDLIDLVVKPEPFTGNWSDAISEYNRKNPDNPGMLRARATNELLARQQRGERNHDA